MSAHPLISSAEATRFYQLKPNLLDQTQVGRREFGLETRAEDRHLEVDRACVVVNSLEQCGGEAEVHRERRHIRLGSAQLAQGTHRQRLERHIAWAARKV